MSGAFVKQLINARESSAIQEVANVCSTGDQYRNLVNDAIELLMDRGGWVGSEVIMRLCGTGCMAVFPRYVGTILGLRPCCGDYVDIRNHWWSIVAPAYGVNGWGIGGSFGYNASGYNYGYGGYHADAVDSNNVPIFNQVSGNTGKLIRYHVVKQQD